MKISREHHNMNIRALNDSPLPQREQLIATLNEIMNNDTLSTCHENVVIELDKHINVSPGTGQRLLSTIKNFMTRDKRLLAGSVHNYLFTFKHPSTMECTQPGKCGFLVRTSVLDEINKIVELNTNSEDYTGTGLHLHDIISARNMHLYSTWSGNMAPDKKVQVGGGWRWDAWLPNVTDWKYEQVFFIYNISDYLVTKHDWSTH